jgi:hypothetical protein
MLFDQEIFTTTTDEWAIFRNAPEWRHRIKMNKAEIRELIALIPVYPDVETLSGISGERA